MGDVFFVLRALLITVVLVFFMQIRIGSSTIEQHSVAWLQNSILVDNLRAVANGTIKVVGEGYRYLGTAFSKDKGEAKDGESKHHADKEKEREGDTTILGMKIRRSEAYHRQKERERKARGADEGSNESEYSSESPADDSID